MDVTQNTETKEKKWIVDTGEGVWEADAETLAQWIMEGAVLPHHKLSREGVRWLEAGKVPQFALLFIGQAEVVQAPLPPVDDLKPPVREEAAVGVPPAHDEYEVYDSFRPPAPPSFALRLAASSFLALLIAVVISYVWAFHLASKRPISEVEKDPTVVELVEKHEKEKTLAQAAAAPVPASITALEIPEFQHVRRNPKYVKINVPNNLSDREKQAHREAYLRDFNPKDNPEMFEPEFLPPSSAPKKAAPTPTPAAADPAVAQRMQQLETKFEAEKQKAVDAVRSQDAKSKFVSSVGFLFLLLGGLNVGRMKFYDKKGK